MIARVNPCPPEEVAESDDSLLETVVVLFGMACTAIVLCGLYTQPPKQPRTRQESRFHHFYSRMKNDEFRAAFRVPRPLFDTIVELLRPHLSWEYDSSFLELCSESALYLMLPFTAASSSLQFKPVTHLRLCCVVVNAPSRAFIPHERVSCEDKVAALLKRVASGTCYRELGYEFAMSTSYCQRVCQDVAVLFSRVFAHEVRVPTRADALESAALFKDRFGFDGCCYAIDGTHIRLRCGSVLLASCALNTAGHYAVSGGMFLCVLGRRSATDTKEAHWCFKQFHSFHLHAMVDNKCGSVF
jgi:hypothetical protein